MSDPFSNNSSKQLIQEAQRGIAVVGVLLAMLAYIVFFKFGNALDEVPEHVRRAPVANTVWPYDQAPQNALPQQVADHWVEYSPRETFATSDQDRLLAFNDTREAQSTTTSQIPETSQFPEAKRLFQNQPTDTLPVDRLTWLNQLDAPFGHDLENVNYPWKTERTSESFLPPTPSDTVESNQSQPTPNEFQVNSGEVQTAGFWEEVETQAEVQLEVPIVKDEPLILTKQEDLKEKVDSVDKTPSIGKHVVKADESFWTISQQYYGDGKYFRQLYEYNRAQVGDYESLAPGITLKIPPLERLKGENEIGLQTTVAPENRFVKPAVDEVKPERRYLTQAGDTLFSIAADQLGQASRYLEIWELNRSLFPPDLELSIPLPVQLSLRMPEP